MDIHLYSTRGRRIYIQGDDNIKKERKWYMYEFSNWSRQFGVPNYDVSHFLET